MTGRRWPLLLIAASAAAAIWSGWVGLGELCGFGVIHPLPGIAPGFQINAAITLPIGVEAYAAYALGAWMSPASPRAARKFAKRSAIGALILGCAGQIVFHLLAASGADKAPWPVVVGVSCIPVIVLGFAAGLTHLLRLPAEPETASARASASASATVRLPPLREIQARQNCGQGTARKIRAELAAYERSRGVPPPVAVVPAGAAPPPVPAPAGALNGHGQSHG